MPTPSQIHLHKSGRSLSGAKPLQIEDDHVESAFSELSVLGINIGRGHLKQMMTALTVDVQDAADGFNAPIIGQTTPSIVTVAQFLQAWLPGFVRRITAARKIDLFTGITTIGDFEDEEVIQGQIEMLGHPEPYTDYGNIPYASWNIAYERRSLVRYELGMQVGYLENLRAAKAKIDTAAQKRSAVSENLEVERNKVGFYGFNSGANRTYGFLNDPSLPAASSVATGATGGTAWTTKTFLEITLDLRTAAAALRTNSMDTIDPSKDPIVLALPTSVREYLTTVTNLGVSVMDWIEKCYPNWRIESAPQFQLAVGGVNVFYLYAESVDDGSDDGGQTFMQFVPAKFLTIGVAKGAKSYEEDYANCLGGVMLKRPYALVRYIGI